MKLIYVSSGNIPSKWAHSIQIMKMSEAFAQEVEKFELVTMTDIKSFFKNDFDFYSWYGISKKFKLTRIPLELSKSSPIYEGYNYPNFDRSAIIYCRLKSPDIVYTRKPNIASWCVRLGLKVILETHGPLNDSKINYVEKIKHNRNLLGIVTISPYIKEWYIKELEIDKNKIIVAHDGVSLENYNVSISRDFLLKKYGIPLNKKLVVYCGHLYQDRGIDDIIECAKDQDKNFFLCIGGWKSDVEEYEGKTKNIKNILFTGFVPNIEVPGFLKSADCILMPYSSKLRSAKWASPLKMFEYMAAKVPIVATKLSSIEEILKHDENAFLVEPDNWISLSEGIKKVLENQEYSKIIADNAYKDVQKYSYKNRAKEILNYFLSET